MDWLTTFPLVVGVIGNLSTSVMGFVAERVLTILLALLVIGGVGAFAVAGLARLWLKRVFGEPASPSVAPH